MAFFASTLIVFFAYLACAAFVAVRGKHTWPNYFFACATALTAVWALCLALADSGLIHGAWVAAAAKAARDASWFAVVIALIRQDHGHQSLWRRLSFIAGALVLLELGFALSGVAFQTSLGLPLTLPTIDLAVAIFGLTLVENLMRNLPASRKWSLRFMAIALATFFTYDTILCIPEFLGTSRIGAFINAEPLVYLLILPLFIVSAVRNDSLRLKMHSSRNLVFYSATLMFAGILLQGTAAAAFYLRNFGGAPVVVLSIVLGISCLLGIVIAISSHSTRSQIRVFINENFFSYRYDYRLEWKKFIESLSTHEGSTGPERVLRTLANLLDSPGGVLWVKREGWQQFIALAHWSLGESFGPIGDDEALLKPLLDNRSAFLELKGKETLPEAVLWRERFPKAWLVVPLYFRDDLIAIALLQEPRANRKLDWEDRNLVALVSLELGAHLAHEHTAQVLADTQHLAEFNQRVTFAVHDLKNTAGQLSLLVKNAERFADNAEFRKDMMATISHAVDNLQSLIARLRGEDQGSSAKAAQPSKRIDVCELVARVAEQKLDRHVKIDPASADQPVYATLERPGELESALEHVIANAVEASPDRGSVRLSVVRTDNQIRVQVTDHGPGMSQDFIAHDLFRPLKTTKKNGMGIGAYQARTMLRDLGGDIEVQSILGEGTTVTLLLPAQDASQGLMRA